VSRQAPNTQFEQAKNKGQNGKSAQDNYSIRPVLSLAMTCQVYSWIMYLSKLRNAALPQH
jgi:hypothetical protein